MHDFPKRRGSSLTENVVQIDEETGYQETDEATEEFAPTQSKKRVRKKQNEEVEPVEESGDRSVKLTYHSGVVVHEEGDNMLYLFDQRKNQSTAHIGDGSVWTLDGVTVDSSSEQIYSAILKETLAVVEDESILWTKDTGIIFIPTANPVTLGKVAFLQCIELTIDNVKKLTKNAHLSPLRVTLTLRSQRSQQSAAQGGSAAARNQVVSLAMKNYQVAAKVSILTGSFTTRFPEFKNHRLTGTSNDKINQVGSIIQRCRIDLENVTADKGSSRSGDMKGLLTLVNRDLIEMIASSSSGFDESDTVSFTPVQSSQPSITFCNINCPNLM